MTFSHSLYPFDIVISYHCKRKMQMDESKKEKIFQKYNIESVSDSDVGSTANSMCGSAMQTKI